MAGRWDRDRFEYEQDRMDRGRTEEDRYYMRGGRGRDHSDERYDRRYHRAYDDYAARDRRYYDEEPSPGYVPRREPAPAAPEYNRRTVIEREREQDRLRPSRPAFLRRQSSLDTFDRRPSRPFYEREEYQEYPPPARREDIYREDYRAPAYTDIPLPRTKTKALPAPRRYDDRYYEDIKVAEPDYYGDDDYRPHAERVQEREVVRTRRRRESFGSPTRSHSTRTRSRRGSSPTSTTTSRSSSSSGGTTIRSEYPKKGKTRIPARLVSKRALIDLGYPYTEEGNTVIVQKALGQENIDELLKLSEDYKKSEMEVAAARSSAGDIVKERRDELAALPPPPMTTTLPPATMAPPPPVNMAPPPPVNMAPPPPPPAPYHAAPGPPPGMGPPPPHMAPGPPPPPPGVTVPPPPPLVMATPGPTPVVIDARPVSPTTTSTSSSDSYYHHHHHHEQSAPIAVGPLALAERSRSRSRSRNRRDIRAEIKALERELVHRPKDSLGPVGDREIVRAERLPDGQLVIYEEQVEKVIHHHKPPRIEKDKKGPNPRLVRAMLSTLT